MSLRRAMTERAEASDPGLRDLLEERLRFSYVVVGVFGLLAATGVHGTGVIEHSILEPQALSVLSLSLASLAGALACHSLSLSLRGLRALDVGIQIVMALCAATMCWVGPQAVEARFVSLMIVTLGGLWRATLVPSSAGRTLVLMGLVTLPILVPHFVTVPGLNQGHLVPAVQEAGVFVVWTSGVVILSTFTSKIIYDLRKDLNQLKRLGRYELEERIGAGGMGEVFRARHDLLRRPTAVKLLLPDRAGENAVSRFEQEVQITASLAHPNTIAVYDYGRTADRLFYYAMELLDGMDLEEVVRRSGPLPPRRVIHILLQVMGSLGEAHGRGLIHRDVKAANVMLCRRGGIDDFVKVLDFGLARREEAPTVGGDLIAGTPSYLAPEAWLGERHADARTDLYAVGVLGWFLLGGQLPFAASSLIALCAAHQERPPPPLEGPAPERLERLLEGLLAKDPADRPTGADVVSTLESMQEELGAWTQREAAAWWSDAGAIPRRPLNEHGLPETLVLPPDRLRTPSKDP